MAVFDAVICKHFSVHVKKHCFLILHGMVLTHAMCNETFYTLRCPAPFWLIQCKPYRNRFITAKVIDKSLGARFYGPLCICVFMLITNSSGGRITCRLRDIIAYRGWKSQSSPTVFWL